MLSRLPSSFRRLSIKRKLTLIITGTSCFALALACTGFILHDVLTFRRVTLENAGTLAAIVGNSTAAALTFNDEAAAAEVLGALVGEPNVMEATLYREGAPFAHYRRAGTPSFSRPVLVGAEKPRFTGGRLELTHPIGGGGRTLGVLHLAIDLRSLDELLQRYLVIAGALLLISVLAAYGLSSAFQRVVSLPIAELAEVARRISEEKDYRVRAPQGHDAELGVLFNGFNAMLHQIEQQDGALRAARDELDLRVQERTAELRQQVAVRISAEHALQQQLSRISLLNRIANGIANRQDLDSIVRIVLGELEARLPVDFGSVSVTDRNGDRLVVAAARRRGTPVADTEHPLAPQGSFLPGLAAFADCRTGHQTYFPDTANQRVLPLADFAAAGLRSVVSVPLMVERRLFGLLVVARANVSAFSSGECEFLGMLAEQVAVAGSQARLYSELQRAYTELRESQRAVMQQERLRALGQMASGIAHDINNTLTPVVAFSSILLEHEQGLTPDGRKQLGHVLTAGRDIAKIVARLREFYRPRDTQEAHSSFNLTNLVEQVIELTRPRWRDMPQARGVVIHLVTEFAPGLPSVSGNDSELREALINLVLNAVDAMPQGGTLTLRTRVDNDHVVVDVGDSGVGMDEETRARCLEPFFSTKGQLGTGLGLAMVFGVMERHAGRIDVESAKGRGTTMRLFFPLTAHEQTATNDPFVRAAAGEVRRVLCVDDEPMLRTVLEALFRHEGHDVTVAGGGEEGLRLYREAAAQGRAFDVVFTDLDMPDMDGNQFATALKRTAPHARIVLLTGWGKIMQQDGDAPSVVDAVLSKPPRPQDLREVLQRILST